ncbi:hypothetical protein M409DRAFT_63457 [Zasmidium cellare ATCC 36951]|uniref:ATP-grasp domain-containing protein n=1 Tax=Zasmidium cellare ATCC 36951 TaxID=1080233 RepID=A0A6A6CXI0_ZASCE|nr:uncharacterized protein M409DRAFT_63457 [Zasmidium cellare ATCC 36951]KAF2171917.1 hypothetical protein M409DRAFT_63457 [Zasmidium cellare ATCC 36951]
MTETWFGVASAAPARDLRILITNGRFPVSLDLARQLYTAGHVVFCVDPMEYHVCKFSISVSQSQQVPAPHDDPAGYIEAVKDAISRWDIDMVIPIHEEIFHLAGSKEPQILSRLFAPPFDLLVRLHHKFEFSRLMREVGLDVPESYLCKDMHDVMNLPVDKYPHGMALKPCFGRASSGVYHLRPGEPIPDDIDISEDRQHVAQEWLIGNRYCSYSVVQQGRVEATGLYPVLDTIDGSSSVFFVQRYHEGVYRYIEDFVKRVPSFSGQIAFDFIETSTRLVAIECNPRSTSGLHLWSNTPHLAHAITHHLPKEELIRPILPPKTRALGRESHFQVAAGMLMWEHKNATLSVWASHMRRLVLARDVVWRWLDPMPTVAQPFLLTEYYRICRREGLQLPEMFQRELVWEPRGAEWAGVRSMLEGKMEDTRPRDSHQEDEKVEVWQVGFV